MTLIDRLEAAEGEVRRLKQQIAGATCAEIGHDWKHIGGANAGCGLYCGCSVPVYTCTKCDDSDYGENPEAEEIKRECLRSREERP